MCVYIYIYVYTHSMIFVSFQENLRTYVPTYLGRKPPGEPARVRRKLWRYPKEVSNITTGCIITITTGIIIVIVLLLLLSYYYYYYYREGLPSESVQASWSGKSFTHLE